MTKKWEGLPAHMQEAVLDNLDITYTRKDLEAFAVESLDELYGEVRMGDLCWSASSVMKEMDPIAFREFVNNEADAFCSAENLIEISTKGPRPLTFYVNKDDLEQAIDNVISPEDIEDNSNEEE